MSTSSYAIFDATGEIRRVIMGGEDTVLLNLAAEESYLDAGGSLVNGNNRYVKDPGGSPVIADRPDMGATIPGTVAPGDDLIITDVADGATITVCLRADGSVLHSGTKTGGAVTYTASPLATSDGDVLAVTVELFPYRLITSEVLVVAP